MLNTTQIGEMALHVLQMDYHRPFVNGKSNRAKIEDMVTIGCYSGEIPPIAQSDVDMICDIVDDLINQYKVKQ